MKSANAETKKPAQKNQGERRRVSERAIRTYLDEYRTAKQEVEKYPARVKKEILVVLG